MMLRAAFSAYATSSQDIVPLTFDSLGPPETETEIAVGWRVQSSLTCDEKMMDSSPPDQLYYQLL